MSTGHLKGEVRPEKELYVILGEVDTPELYARPVKLDTSHTIAYAGGNSVDGKTVYIDRDLYRDVKTGKVSVKGMSPDQIIQAWIEHEHAEWAIDVGDNSLDVYEPCHEFATTKEHKFVEQLNVDPSRYEEAIKPALERTLKRPQTNPPKDLWCGPYLDHADKHDREILRQFRAKGVEDAFKESKFDNHYGFGAEQCKNCAMFHRKSGPLGLCDRISGMVRENRWCQQWTPKKGYWK